ncbi:MAG: cysteine desulfurase [candidate division WWE3 bacterium]|nr:cysteine desulfurase [candidate division WWE3 bacterium]
MSFKDDFPILNTKINGHNLVYLDNAATSQKPRQFIEALTKFYENDNANVHRGNHTLADRATEAYELTRQTVAKFINANPTEIIFTKNTTEAINLVAYAWGRSNLHEGDTIITTELEHHSNLIPWYILAKEKHLNLQFIKVAKSGQLDLNSLDEILKTQKNIKLLALTAVSNVLGTIVPVANIIKMVKEKFPSCLVLVDGAQSVPSLKTDVKKLGCDFLAFSAHKMLGPTGVGVLYGRQDLLDVMPPFLTGGSMIDEVVRFEATYAPSPQKFEAGTPNIADVVAFKASLDYLTNSGLDKVEKIEKELADYARQELRKIPNVTVYGDLDATNSLGIVSFNIKGIHPHDVSTLLDQEGVAVRSGHHCAAPLMKILGVPGTVRASFYLYNDLSDVEALIRGVKKAIKVFK